MIDISVDEINLLLIDRSRLDRFLCFFFFQAEDGIRDRSVSRGLGDVYKRRLLGYLTYILLTSVCREIGTGSLPCSRP